MKLGSKLNLLLIILCTSSVSAVSFAQTLKDVFTNSEAPLTYLGIDFTKAKLIGPGDASEIRNRLYGSINSLIITEAKKYDIASAFSKTVVNNDIAAVTANNDKANINEILSTNPADFNRLKESDIAASVKALDLAGKQGVGLLFVMEAMRKVDKESDAAIWVTLVDMKTKKVLMTERVESKVLGGIGFRNYWASTIKNLLNMIEKKKYKEWQAKYGK